MIERYSKLRLDELTPFAGVGYEIKSEDLPCHVFVRLVKPKLKGWHYVGELSLEESSLDYWQGNDVMDIIYSAVDFDPIVAERFGLKTPWVVEYAFYSDISPTKKPKGRKILSFVKTLYKPEYYASNEGIDENIPETMKPYLANYREKKKEEIASPQDVILSTLEKQLAKLDGATLLALIQSGLLNLDALKAPKGEAPKSEKVVEEKTVVKDNADLSIVDEIIREAEVNKVKQEVVREEPRETNIIQTLREGFELIKQLPDVANSIKEILSSFGLSQNQNTQVIDTLKKHQQAFDILLKDYEKLKREVNKLKEETRHNKFSGDYLDMLSKEVENESPRKDS